MAFRLRLDIKAVKPLYAAFFFLALLFMSVNSWAFHDGGVGLCEGCHTMHNSSDNQPITFVGGATQFNAPNSYLLKGSDSSSTCLNCHNTTNPYPTDINVSSPYVSGIGPSQMTPGGDFGWLKHNYSWIASNATTMYSYGYNHGHNIEAADYGYSSVSTTAPGGTYPGQYLGCTSCHDPHGRYREYLSGGTTLAIAAPDLSLNKGLGPIVNSGSYGAAPQTGAAVGVYRLLGGVGYQPVSVPGSYAFANPPPYAVAPLDFNRAESASSTRVAYGQGMGNWCENCHTNVQNDYKHGYYIPPGGSIQQHPMEDYFTSLQINNYNAYVKTGVYSGATATAFTSLVSFELGTNNLATLSQATSSTAGPDANSEVFCLTCHRAHASGWDYAGRWNFIPDYIVYNSGWGIDDGAQSYPDTNEGRTSTEASHAYYGRTPSMFATNQQSLCNKCHYNWFEQRGYFAPSNP